MLECIAPMLSCVLDCQLFEFSTVFNRVTCRGIGIIDRRRGPLAYVWIVGKKVGVVEDGIEHDEFTQLQIPQRW